MPPTHPGPRGQAVLVTALVLGLAIAALPVLATRGRACASPTAPAPDAPAYLVLTRDPRIEELRCEADGRVAFIRVRTAAEVDARLSAAEIAGVILDRNSYEGLRPGHIRDWLIAGSGRAVIGFDLTAGQLRADAGGPLPPDPNLPSPYLGGSYVGDLSFRTSPRGTCGGGGTTPYRGSHAAAALVDRLVEWSARDCGAP